MLRNLILRWARARKPDFIIGGTESPYLRRHWLLPRNPIFNIYVHEFLRSDDDRALHDHPWLFNASWLIDGDYVERAVSKRGVEVRERRRAALKSGSRMVGIYEVNSDQETIAFTATPRYRTVDCGAFKFRWGRAPHRVELLDEYIYHRFPGPGWVGGTKPCWTVFITGPRIREWGFLCPRGWVPWQQFTDTRDKGAIGRGCD